MKKYKIRKFVILCLLLLSACDGDEAGNGVKTNTEELASELDLFHAVELKDVEAAGTVPRLEREYKYSFVDGHNFRLETLDSLAKIAFESLEERVGVEWYVDENLGEKYYLDEDVKDFVYLDVYFDTEDDLNYQNSVSYRLRERYKSMKDFEKHFENLDEEKYWPFRIEFQGKFDREDLGEGFSKVWESRFEFREESEPFSKDNPPPAAPWDLREFIDIFQSGSFREYFTWPAKSVVSYLNDLYPEREKYFFQPKLVLVTERNRMHLNLETPWGSGPNPEQVFIISVDQSKVYDADDFLRFVEQSYGGQEGKMPNILGDFMEVEVEFERNVSTKLDEELEGNEDLEAVRQAFLEDQRKIMNLLKMAFAQRGIQLVAADKSKYLQAFEISPVFR